MRLYLKVILVQLIITFSFIKLYSQDCEPTKNCQFYLCKEDKWNCGKKGYLLNYGSKYCNFFLSKYYNQFTKKGKEWATNTAYGLQEQLSNLPDSVSCKEIKKIAIKGHLSCVINSGYCDLPKKDKKIIFKIVAKNPGNWLRGLFYLRKIRRECKK